MKYYSIEPFKIENFSFLGCNAYQKDNNALIINNKTGITMMLDGVLLHNLFNQKICDDFKFKLIQRGFACIKNVKNDWSYKDEVNPSFFMIDLTNKCNMKCCYCFRDQKKHSNSIDICDLREICNYIANYCKNENIDNFTIQPWGGEPLIEFEKIIEIRKIFSLHNLHPNISIETNGVLLNEVLVKQIIEHDIRIGISLDGVKDLHNMQRPDIHGNPTYEKVLYGLSLLTKYNIKDIGLICVITNKSLEYLESIIDFFCYELPISSFKLNIVKPSRDTQHLALSEKQVSDFAGRLFDRMFQNHKNGSRIIESNILDRINNLLFRTNRNICMSNGCNGGKKLISFGMDKNLYPCELTDFREYILGTIYDDQNIKRLVTTAIEKNEIKFFDKKEKPDCEKCSWWPYCKGGCTSAVIYKDEPTKKVDEVTCTLNKVLYPKIIELILSDSKIVNSLFGGKL